AKQVIEDLGTNDTGVIIQALSTLSTLPAVNNVPVEVLNATVTLLRTTEKRLVLTSTLVAIKHLTSFDRTKMMYGDSTTLQEALLQHIDKFNSPNTQFNVLEILLNMCTGYDPNQVQLMTMA
ncbi:invs-b, partial [Acrasis kona]